MFTGGGGQQPLKQGGGEEAVRRQNSGGGGGGGGKPTPGDAACILLVRSLELTYPRLSGRIGVELNDSRVIRLLPDCAPRETTLGETLRPQFSLALRVRHIIGRVASTRGIHPHGNSMADRGVEATGEGPRLEPFRLAVAEEGGPPAPPPANRQARATPATADYILHQWTVDNWRHATGSVFASGEFVDCVMVSSFFNPCVNALYQRIAEGRDLVVRETSLPSQEWVGQSWAWCCISLFLKGVTPLGMKRQGCGMTSPSADFVMAQGDEIVCMTQNYGNSHA